MKCLCHTLLLASLLGLAAPSHAQSPSPGKPQAAGISGDVIRIGFVTDLSGFTADVDGPGGVQAIRLAIEDAGGQIAGKKIELLTIDHQHRSDIAAAAVSKWIDQDNVDVIIGGTNSSANLAIAHIIAAKKVPFFAIGAGTDALTNKDCTPYTVHYAYNSIALARGTAQAVVQHGGKTWFFLTSDYAFGKDLERESVNVIKASGGKVLGSVYTPLNTPDYSSFVMQAQGSPATVLGLANAGGDFINAVKSAAEFGVNASKKIVGLLVFISDIHGIGLKDTQGMYLTTPWYWDQNEATRAWSQRFEAVAKRKPTMLQAADYGAVSFYLKAVGATGSDDPDTIMHWVKSQKAINDLFIRNGHVRRDGLMVHDMMLMQVKTPEESSGAWDYYKKIADIPGARAFQTEVESTCQLP